MATSSAKGSSPLARGLPNKAAKDAEKAGIIPARAGFTRRLSVGDRIALDHPRSRGVYHSGASQPSVFHGSSPLARGLLNERKFTTNKTGIIPARAGFTTPEWPLDALNKDHPRSRGVYG